MLLSAFSTVATSKMSKEKKKLGKQFRFLQEAELERQKIDTDADLTEFEFMKYNWASFTRKFELQIISSFGNPITKILTYINGEKKDWWSDIEEMAQSLEGMSYSVLKSFVDKQESSLKLQRMKIRKPEDEGYEFLIFDSFYIGTVGYLTILNVDNYNPKAALSIPYLKGDEILLLNRITRSLKTHTSWFSGDSDFLEEEIVQQIEQLITAQIYHQYH